MSTLTFKATSAITSAYFEGVSIAVTDGTTSTTLTTDSSGEATYTPTNTSVSYTASYSGYTSVTGTVNTSSDQTIDISMVGSTSTDKAVFAVLKAALKELISNIKTAVKNEVLSDIETYGEELITKAKVQLVASSSYYEDKLNAASSWKDKLNYTSMLIGINILIIEVNTLDGTVLSYVTSKVSSILDKA